MVIVNVAQKGDQLKDAILASDLASTYALSFDKKAGIKYYFTSNNDAEAAPAIKKFIKSNPSFSFLYTSVEAK